jgi:preprotein translocase subunit SecA
MFSLFRKQKKLSFPDKVWKTDEIMWKQVATEALQTLKRNEIPLVVFFFQEDLERFDRYLSSLQVPFIRFSAATFGNEQATVFTLRAHSIESLTGQLTRRPGKGKLIFLFIGHYPLPAFETKILQKITDASGNEFSLSFWISLDDPLMKTFGSDRILSIMESLGMKDDECIEHPMVTKSIFRARGKISNQVKNEIEAASAREWFEKNIRKNQ